MIGPNPDDPYHPDVPLVKSEEGATEILGYLRMAELGRIKLDARRDIQVASQAIKIPFPYWKRDTDAAENTDDLRQEEAQFTFVWRGLVTPRKRLEVETYLRQVLPDLVSVLYDDCARPRNVYEQNVEWNISPLVAIAEFNLIDSKSLTAILHPSQRERFLQWYLAFVLVLLIAALFAVSIAALFRQL